MRQGPNNKRMRGRGNGRKGGHSRNQSFESNGPEVKVRGNAQQVVEKYLTLARDASSTGDRINAESYFQFAEHYYRVMNANAANEQQRLSQVPAQEQTNETPLTGGVSNREDKPDPTDGVSVENGVNGRSRRRNSSHKKRENGGAQDVADRSQTGEVSEVLSSEETERENNSDPVST